MNIRVPTPGLKTGADLLSSRGIKDIDRFLNNPNPPQSWKDLKNIEKGLDLIKYLKESERVPERPRFGLVVDSDCDGYTSATIIYHMLQELFPNAEIVYYIHSEKQHGLEDCYNFFSQQNLNALFVPDAGSNDSIYACALADVPILVLDHHEIEAPVVASNLIVINVQDSPDYLNKDLSGAGVAWQFAQAVNSIYHFAPENFDLDLAAVGICGDMMSALSEENQWFWKHGFSKLHNSFLITLARKQSYSITGLTGLEDEELFKCLNPTSIAFYIVPLINAMVRMGTIEEKTRMFLAFVDGSQIVVSNKRGAKGEAVLITEESVRECTNAKTHQNSIKDKAIEELSSRILESGALEDQILIVDLDAVDVPSTMSGVIATQLSQLYRRPTIVGRYGQEDFKGSIRSLNNCALPSFKDYLISTGLFNYVQGHANASGQSIPVKNIPLLIETSNKDLSQYDFNVSYYDADFDFKNTDPGLATLIFDLEKYKNCWGQQNQEPLIHIRPFAVKRNTIKVMGKNHDTIKIEANGISFIKFFAKNEIDIIDMIDSDDLMVEIVGTPKINEWNGRVTPQILITEIFISPIDFSF